MHTTEEDGRHMLIEGARQAAAQATAAAGRNTETVEALAARVARIERMLGIAPLVITAQDVLTYADPARTPTDAELRGAEVFAESINAIIAKAARGNDV